MPRLRRPVMVMSPCVTSFGFAPEQRLLLPCSVSLPAFETREGWLALAVVHHRWGGVALLLTALALIAGAILVVVVPFGGLANPAAGVAYYVALVLAAPSVAALYGLQAGSMGRLGLVGFTMGSMGAVLYGTGAFLVLPIAENLEAAHDVWVYGMARAPVIPLGGALFLIGLTLLGIATVRGGEFHRRAGMLLAAGAAAWFVAFFFSMAGAFFSALLPVGSLLVGAALAWVGWSLIAEARSSPLP